MLQFMVWMAPALRTQWERHVPAAPNPDPQKPLELEAEGPNS